MTQSVSPYDIRQTEEGVAGRRPSLVRWGPSFAGAVSAIATGALFSALWYAIGYGSGLGFVAHNMSWFFLATVLGSLLVGGVIAGRVASLGGIRVGIYDGMIVWGLTVIAALIPLSLRGLSLASSGVGNPAANTAFSISSGDAWALFGALIGGWAAAVVGGLVGGAGRSTEPVASGVESRATERTLRRTG